MRGDWVKELEKYIVEMSNFDLWRMMYNSTMAWDGNNWIACTTPLSHVMTFQEYTENASMFYLMGDKVWHSRTLLKIRRVEQ